jgi:hypothetical protein
MATLDNLPADQRAVLQLVLQRSRGYDEIARLLSMDRAAVRERALNAFDALGPKTGVADGRRALITDYLLGQLPPAVTTQVRDHLAESPSERAWARVLASELAPLANRPLPEIPTALDRGPAPVSAAAAAEPEEAPEARVKAKRVKDRKPKEKKPKEKKQRESILLRRRRTKRAAQDAAGGGAAGAAAAPAGIAPDVAAATGSAPPSPPTSTSGQPDGGGERPRSSRMGGAILIAVGVLIVVAVVVLLTRGSNGNHPKPASAASVTSSSTTAPATSGTTTGSTTSGAHVISQVNLKPPGGSSKAAGIAEVLKEGTNDGIAIVAQNVPPNSKKPPNAYAVWLYNSAQDAKFLGFVNPGVGTNGRLSTAGGLPSNAAHFHQLIVTVETVAHPKAPGTIILSGALSGL